MAWVLVAAFCLLSGAYAQEWGVTLAPGPLDGWAGSCVTIPCSFTYPAGWTVSAVSWTRDGDQTVYHSDEALVHADFKGRVRYLGDLQHNCSLRVAGLRPSDQGTYRFLLETVGDGKNDAWTGQPGQRLRVFGAYAQDWDVTLTPGPLAGWVGSCVTIPCSFTYPAGWTVRAVSWTRDGDQTVYHSDEARVHGDFKGRVRYLGDLQHNCSLRVARLRPKDRGTYSFRFHAAGNGCSDTWMGQPGRWINVSGNQALSCTLCSSRELG